MHAVSSGGLPKEFNVPLLVFIPTPSPTGQRVGFCGRPEDDGGCSANSGPSPLLTLVRASPSCHLALRQMVAFPSVSWESIWAMLAEMRAPGWATYQCVAGSLCRLKGPDYLCRRRDRPQLRHRARDRAGVPELWLGLGTHLRPSDPVASHAHARATR